ncbi:MAG: hypothetical protein CMM07_03630 [Rhodopirellula sp.]|nr:hypothetical protein [Rhodopirellula sp.]
MFAFRQLTAYLCIASLLLSSVAGWLHVGCVEASSSCCVQASVIITETTITSTVGRVEPHACCKHQHRDETHQENESSLDKEQENPQQPHVPGNDNHQHKHDSERCSVCQSFFSLRNATTTQYLEPTFSSDATEPASPDRGSVVDLKTWVNGISVRGPPRA